MKISSCFGVAWVWDLGQASVYLYYSVELNKGLCLLCTCEKGLVLLLTLIYYAHLRMQTFRSTEVLYWRAKDNVPIYMTKASVFLTGKNVAVLPMHVWSHVYQMQKALTAKGPVVFV